MSYIYDKVSDMIRKDYKSLSMKRNTNTSGYLRQKSTPQKDYSDEKILKRIRFH